jgi:AAA15 family ATPase/GTPase
LPALSPITLRSIEYFENEGTATEWKLKKSFFDKINLIVGRNASGKTRLVNIINGLSVLLTNGVRPPFS